MSLITVSLKHDKTLEESRQDMESIVKQLQDMFGILIQQTVWSPDRSEVRLDGRGFWIELSVDDVLFHMTGDILVLGHLLGSGISSGVQQIVQKTFQKQLR